MEPFSLIKFGKSFFEFLPWVKTMRYLIGILIVALIAGVIYTKFFKKTNTQNTTFQGDVEEVNIINKASRVFIPFVEASIGDNDGEFDAALRAGLRFEL